MKFAKIIIDFGEIGSRNLRKDESMKSYTSRNFAIFREKLI